MIISPQILYLAVQGMLSLWNTHLCWNFQEGKRISASIREQLVRVFRISMPPALHGFDFHRKQELCVSAFFLNVSGAAHSLSGGTCCNDFSAAEVVQLAQQSGGSALFPHSPGTGPDSPVFIACPLAVSSVKTGSQYPATSDMGFQ